MFSRARRTDARLSDGVLFDVFLMHELSAELYRERDSDDMKVISLHRDSDRAII